MNQESIVDLRLPRIMVGQILDGLEVLAADWEYTAEVDGGVICPVEEGRHVRECSGAEEALKIAEFYRQIIDRLTKQLL
ncbi:MAG: hypothetical protein ACT4QC_08335 [Planctomycetaceae bacterium]